MAEPPPVGWGILGCGRFARRRILPALAASPLARAVALQRRSLPAARETAAAHGVPGAYASREALLADPAVEAVFVASHNAGHLPDVLAAAAAGKPVLCEKPLGRTAAEAAEMVAACREAGVPLFTGHCYRYSHAVEEARGRAAAGDLGPLVALRGQYSFLLKGRPWQEDARLSGGGPLVDLGPHLVDFFRFATGAEVEEARARVAPARDLSRGACEQEARAILSLSGGITATLEVSYREPFRNGFEVSGGAACLRSDYTLTRIDENPAVALVRVSADPHPPRVERIPVVQRDVYRLEIEDVSRAIRDPEHRPRCASGEDGLAAMRVVDAIYLAGERGRAVPVGGEANP